MLALDPVTEPGDLIALFDRDRAVHPYGLADVSLFWDRSHWWRSGDAAVGLLSLPGADTPVVYAVSATAPKATLELLSDLATVLPDRFVITGPVGLAARLGQDFTPRWTDRYRKMHLASPDRLPRPAADIDVLSVADLDQLVALFDTDPDAGDFFDADLLASGHYVGRRRNGALIACAGVHVVDPGTRVAAIGNVATHPDHRRQGHARDVLTTMCRRLLDEVDTVGLNVRDRTPGATRLYEQIGFVRLIPYEEAELVRR